jgi:hypothetical protein
MLFDKLTGEVSEVAVCALAGPAVTTKSTAATAAIRAFIQVARPGHDLAEAVYKVSSSHR